MAVKRNPVIWKLQVQFDWYVVCLWAGSVSRHNGLRGTKGEDGRCCRGSESDTQPAGGEVPGGQTLHRGQQDLSG